VWNHRPFHSISLNNRNECFKYVIYFLKKCLFGVMYKFLYDEWVSCKVMKYTRQTKKKILPITFTVDPPKQNRMKICFVVSVWNKGKKKKHCAFTLPTFSRRTHEKAGSEIKNYCVNCQLYDGVSKSFRTDRLERELQTVELSATRCSYIAILWVSLVSFAVIILCVAS